MDNRARTLAKRVFTDQKFGFMVVGVINTLVNIGTFALVEPLIGTNFGDFGYLVTLVISTAVAMCVAFVLHRKFVFKVHGKLLLDFSRFVLTNLFGFAANAAVLSALVNWTDLTATVAQAIAALSVAVLSYLAHKYFSFRR